MWEHSHVIVISFCYSVKDDNARAFSCPRHFVSLLQLNAQCKEDNNDNDVLKHIIVICCFAAMQLCEKDDNVRVFLCRFFFLIVAQCKA